MPSPRDECPYCGDSAVTVPRKLVLILLAGLLNTTDCNSCGRRIGLSKPHAFACASPFPAAVAIFAALGLGTGAICLGATVSLPVVALLAVYWLPLEKRD